MTEWPFLHDVLQSTAPRKVTVSVRTVRAAIEFELMRHTREALEVVLADELKLPWVRVDPPSKIGSKRDLIRYYTDDWPLSELIDLARRIVDDYGTVGNEVPELLAEYARRGGVDTPAKNLIFAANGPKPEIVLRDAVNNDIEIVKNAEYCLVYDEPIPATGLTFQHLIDWWRKHKGASGDDRDVGVSLYRRLMDSLNENEAEQLIFDVYGGRYKEHGFKIPALIPQVYLHYDPYTLRSRGILNGPLARQRMDFLMLFSNRHRVVLELDGQHHYADGKGIADPTRYAAMMTEDRRLRLAGYEIYRFGGADFVNKQSARTLIASFFDELQHRMS
ncbi:hypothetical protein JK358_10245 [Nocardia sp. 2]|uniref:AbiJ-NTD3 domain-containing protein n=1 Tax=Nocardia acididurans TaxID=2802282 RepID=A0ABS1M2N1_9NOCA|nr:hypothetical protein [Nocardia acididurans]MBL1074776.1 hypothetical protein [Nocardia acididurans]